MHKQSHFFRQITAMNVILKNLDISHFDHHCNVYVFTCVHVNHEKKCKISLHINNVLTIPCK